MGFRSKWVGEIKFGLVTCPVKLFKSTEDANKVTFNQLRAECGHPINMKRVCVTCNKDADALKRGYEHAKNQWIEVTDDELKHVMIEASKTIQVTKIVPLDHLALDFIESLDFLAPAEKKDKLVFAVMREALAGKAAIGTLVNRGREEVVAVRPWFHGMALLHLRYENEVRSIHEVTELQSMPPAPPAELRMAQQLIAAYEGDLDMAEYTDHYADAAKALIAQKVAGQPVVAFTAPALPPPMTDLMSALRESISTVPTVKKPTAKATATAKPASKPRKRA